MPSPAVRRAAARLPAGRPRGRLARAAGAFLPPLLHLVLAAPPARGAPPPGLPRLAGFASLSPRLAPEAFRDEYRAGLGGGAGIEAPWRSRLTLVGWISLDHFRLNRPYVEGELQRLLSLDAIDLTGGGVNVITTMAGLRFHAPDVQRPLPYAEALAGVVYAGSNDARVNGVASDLESPGASSGQFAWALGIGVRRQRAGQVGYALSAHVIGARLEGQTLGYCPIRVTIILPS